MKRKAVCWLLICLFLLSGCKKIEDGPAVEILCGTSQRDNRVYHLQNDEFTKVDTWSESFKGGTPNSIRTEIFKRFEDDPCYEYMDQLDDHYVGEDIEAYLFNQIGGKHPTLILYKNGKRVNIDVSVYGNEYRNLRYHDGKLYLMPTGGARKKGYRIEQMCCIDADTLEIKMIEYKTPIHKSVIWRSFTQGGLLLKDNTLIEVVEFIDAKKRVCCISKPNANYYKEILVGEGSVEIVGVFETKEGFAAILTNLEYAYDDSFMTIYYYDRDGNPLSKDELDISLVKKTVKKKFRFNCAIRYLNNGKIIFSVIKPEERSFVFEYDLAKRKMKYIGEVNGWVEEINLINNRDGKTYSVSSQPY